MGEVKRWYPCGNGDSVEMVQFRDDDRFVTSEAPDFVELSDYARLERKRDQAMAAHAEMVREVEASQAEMARLRAVEKAAKTLLDTASATRSKSAYHTHATVTISAIGALAEACGRKG